MALRRSFTLLFAPAAILTALVFTPSISRAQTPTAADASALYLQRCASCHGKTGGGDGEFAAFLVPRPRDFRQARYKFRSTETGGLPTDDDLARSIADGLHGTSMPSWKPFLTAQQVQALVEYIKRFSPRFAAEKLQPVVIGSEPPATPQNIEAGRVAYAKLKCAACHGVDGAGVGAIAQAMLDDAGRPIRATNLSEQWTFRGGSAARDIFLRLRTGMNGTPMPSFTGAATEAELWQLALYVGTLGRRPLWEMTAEQVAAHYAERQRAAARDVVRHGEYVATMAGCVFCHSPAREDNTMIEEFRYAGGQKFEAVPFGTFVSYNLTSDKETGLGNWTDDQIKTFVTSGTRRDGSHMLPYPMPWPNYASMTPVDLNALVQFLRTLPPVVNRIPAPQYQNVVSYLAGKFRMLILRQDPPLLVYPGNAGQARKPSEASR